MKLKKLAFLTLVIFGVSFKISHAKLLSQIKIEGVISDVTPISPDGLKIATIDRSKKSVYVYKIDGLLLKKFSLDQTPGRVFWSANSRVLAVQLDSVQGKGELFGPKTGGLPAGTILLHISK